MGTIINRDLPGNAYDAAIGANTPSNINPYATIADLTGGGDANRLVFDVKINQVGGILKGQAVYVNGANGVNILVGKADYSVESTSATTIGLLITSGVNNDLRQVVAEGILKGTGAAPLDTSAASPGDPIWLGDDGNLIYGAINEPYAPNQLVFIGVVVEANPIVGEIFVKVQNGYELGELHDVDLITNPPTDGQVLTYDNGSGLWKNEDLPAVIGESINANLQPVLDNTISDPSTIIDPNVDDAYLVSVGAIGVWAGQDNNIATWDGEQWIYYVPSALDITTVLTGINAGNVYQFGGVSWVQITSTSPGATPFYLAGSGVDAGGNKTSTIARVGPVTLGSNSGAYGLSRLTVRGTGSLENIVTRWGMGSGSVTGINNWFRIAGFNVNYGTSKNYQILVNIGAKNPNTFASVVLHINISKASPSASVGKAICRVVNVSGPGYLSTFGDGDYRLDESNFEFRRYANASLGTVNFRLYYKPTIADSFMSVTVLNAAGGTTGAIGIQWFNSFLGAAIEAPGPGGSTDNYATFNYSGQRTNISAIIDPTVTDDYALQYTVGSLWYNTVTQKVFQCLDSASGAAVWKQITPFDGALENIILSSTQWGKTLAAPVSLPDGTTANGFTFFDDTIDRVAGGCTSYNEFFLAYTRRLTLTGTSGTANINIDGTDYLATFNTSLTQTATDFVTTHATTILASHGVRVAANTGVLRFGHSASTLLNAITITNVTTNLSGTLDTAITDHVIIPYVGTPYENLRIQHNFRVNFGIAVGSTQTVALSLRRWADDSTIGSEIPIFRNQDVSGQQQNFVSYTASALDPFVIGGFYFALRNDSGTNVNIDSNVGILI